MIGYYGKRKKIAKVNELYHFERLVKIHLIRHAETEANVDSGKPATITEKGEKQIALLATHYAKKTFGKVWSSDQERALKTAQGLAKDPHITKDLREILRTIVGGPEKESRPNRKEEDTKRAKNMWDEMLSWKEERVAVVCHGNIIRYFLARAGNENPETMWQTDIEPCSISTLETHKGNATILSINDTAHLGDVTSGRTEYIE